MASGQVSQPKKKDEWVDVEWEDVTPSPTEQHEPDESLWEWSGKPLWEAPARVGKSLSDWIAEHPELRNELTSQLPFGMAQFVNPGYVQEFPHGVGLGVSALTTPRNLGITALTGGTGLAAKHGFTKLAEIGGRGLQAIGAGQIGHGVYSATQAKDVPDIVNALMETAFGGMGLGYGTGAVRGARVSRLQPGKPLEGLPPDVNAPTAPTMKQAGMGQTPAAAAKPYGDLFTGDIVPGEAPKTITIARSKLTNEVRADIESRGYSPGGTNSKGDVYFVRSAALPDYKGEAPTTSQRTIIDDLVDAKKKVEDLDRKIVKEQKRDNRPAIDRLIIERTNALNKYKAIRAGVTPPQHDEFLFSQKFPEDITQHDIGGTETETTTTTAETEPVEDVSDLVKRLEESLNNTAEINKLLKGVSRKKDNVMLMNPSANIRRRMERMGFKLIGTKPTGEHYFKYVMGPEGPQKMAVGPDEFTEEGELVPPRHILSPKLQNEFFLNERQVEPEIPAGNRQDVERAIYEHEMRNLTARMRGEQPIGARILPFEREEALQDSLTEIPPYLPRAEEMRVKGVKGPSGLENIAMGPLITDEFGNPETRLLDIMGTALYTHSGPSVSVKELLQNAFDEHVSVNTKKPIKVLADYAAINPLTKEHQNSVTVRDYGRGLTLDQLYTIFSDLAKTGKEDVESAAGGFGVAKAAPFLGGKYMHVESIVKEGNKNIKYSFGGTPQEFKNQARGVEITKEQTSEPTGLKVAVYYDRSLGLSGVETIARNIGEGSPNLPSPIEFAENYSQPRAKSTYQEEQDFAREFIHDTVDMSKYHFNTLKTYTPIPLPPVQGTTATQGAQINIHYNQPGRGTERSNYNLTYLNKGLLQATKNKSYSWTGSSVPNVPDRIYADIIATVKEGQTGYPFGLNREEINTEVAEKVAEWIQKNIIEGANRARIEALQKQYDAIQPITPNSSLQYLDADNGFTQDEIQLLNNSPKLQYALLGLQDVISRTLTIADTLNWGAEFGVPNWTVPSARLKKVGLLFSKPDTKGVTLGIHIPNPNKMEESAILINIFEILNAVNRNPIKSIDRLSTALLTTSTHEIAHIPGGGHDTDFAYRHASLLEAIGRENTFNFLNTLTDAFAPDNPFPNLQYGGPINGGIDPEILDLLRVYNESRQRGTSGDDALLATGVSNIGPANSAGITQPNAQSPAGSPPNTKSGPRWRSWAREAYNIPRGLMPSQDLSAPFRQGLGAITYKGWWKAWGPMLRARLTEAQYAQIQQDILNDPLFWPTKNPITGKEEESFAEKIGFPMNTLSEDLLPREEGMATRAIEKVVPGVRAGNRAYTTFLTVTRAEMLKSLLYNARRVAIKAEQTGRIGLLRRKITPEEAQDLNPFTNIVLAKEIMNFVNTGTGRGNLGKHERSIRLLSDIFFAPRLIKSRLDMLNPRNYFFGNPYVRRQYWRSFFGMIGFGLTLASLAKMSGFADEVSTDSNSADFMKIRIGNARFDPWGGFQQFFVLGSRLVTGEVTSSATQRQTELGVGYKAPTRKQIALDFATNKFHPVAKFVNDWADASQYKPFYLGDRTVQLFVPLAIGDIIQVARENPELLPFAIPAAMLGIGTQIYEAGEQTSKFVPQENDIEFTGGKLFQSPFDWEDQP